MSRKYTLVFFPCAAQKIFSIQRRKLRRQRSSLSTHFLLKTSKEKSRYGEIYTGKSNDLHLHKGISHIRKETKDVYFINRSM